MPPEIQQIIAETCDPREIDRRAREHREVDEFLASMEETSRRTSEVLAASEKSSQMRHQLSRDFQALLV